MLARRFALAFGLLTAILASQLPEFVQQYRQRLGGAVDELKRVVTQFDSEAQAQSLSRQQGIDRLRANPDPLAQARGADVEDAARREARLEEQDRRFAEVGPVSLYWVFVVDLDPNLAREAYAIYQPAVPVTPTGFICAGLGFALGWCAMRIAGAPFKRRRRTAAA